MVSLACFWSYLPDNPFIKVLTRNPSPMKKAETSAGPNEMHSINAPRSNKESRFPFDARTPQSRVVAHLLQGRSVLPGTYGHLVDIRNHVAD